jgi:hypothetical protein
MPKDHQTPAPNTTGSNSRLRRFGRMALSTATFSINVGLAAAAVMIGVTTIQMRAEEKPSVDPSPLAVVDVFTPDWETGYDLNAVLLAGLNPHAAQTLLSSSLEPFERFGLTRVTLSRKATSLRYSIHGHLRRTAGDKSPIVKLLKVTGSWPC